MKRHMVAVSLALGLASGAAMADGWYAGFSVGQSRFDSVSKSEIDAALVAGGLGGVSSSLDDTDTAYKAHLGYMIDPHFAVELGYVDLGKLNYDATFTSPGPGTGHGDVKADGVTLELVGSLPVAERFSLLARLGIIKPHVKLDVSAAGGGGSASASTTATNVRFTYGLGAQYDFTPSIGARLEWQRFDKLGNDDTGKGDVDLVSAGIDFRF